MNYYGRKHWTLQRTKEEEYGNTLETQSSKTNRLFCCCCCFYLFFFLVQSPSLGVLRILENVSFCHQFSQDLPTMLFYIQLFVWNIISQQTKIYSFFQALGNTTCLIEWMLLLEASLKDYRCYEQECVRLSIFQRISLQLQFPLSPLLSVSLSITPLARFS